MALKRSTGLRNAQLTQSSVKDILQYGVIRIFSGVQPANADAAETGDLLVEITEGAKAFTSGVQENGLRFAASASAGSLAKEGTQIWSGVGQVGGSAGWFRFYPNDVDTNTGEATSGDKVRFDGSCGTNGDMLMASTTIQSGATSTIDQFVISLPE